MTHLLRLLVLAWSLAAAAMPSGLAVLDAGAEARAYSIEPHVEREGGSSCPEAHDPHCSMCSTMRTGRSEPPAAAHVPVLVRNAGCAPVLWRSGHALAAIPVAARPRAPPALA